MFHKKIQKILNNICILSACFLLIACSSSPKPVIIKPEVEFRKIPNSIILELQEACVPPIYIPNPESITTEEEYNYLIVIPSITRHKACFDALSELYKWNMTSESEEPQLLTI